MNIVEQERLVILLEELEELLSVEHARREKAESTLRTIAQTDGTTVEWCRRVAWEYLEAI